MELSNYSINKLKSLSIANAVMMETAKSEGHMELATDLKYWEGEIRIAIDDAKMEAEQLLFKTNHNLFI